MTGDVYDLLLQTDAMEQSGVHSDILRLHLSASGPLSGVAAEVRSKNSTYTCWQGQSILCTSPQEPIDAQLILMKIFGFAACSQAHSVLLVQLNARSPCTWHFVQPNLGFHCFAFQTMVTCQCTKYSALVSLLRGSGQHFQKTCCNGDDHAWQKLCSPHAMPAVNRYFAVAWPAQDPKVFRAIGCTEQKMS